MNSTHNVVVVSENADPDVINVVVTEGLSLSRRPEPPDRSVFVATLQPITNFVKTLGIGHVVNQLIQDSTTFPMHDANHMSAKQYLRDYNLDFFGWVEPHISGARADYVIRSLGYPSSYRVKANGSSFIIFNFSIAKCYVKLLELES
ncbi:hypothetical protein GQ457_13G021150 [Hibiscus cannabinus]